MAATDPGFVHEFFPATVPDLPTLLLLHGTGGDEHDLVPLGRALLPGAALLSPRGRVLERGMPRFFRRLSEGVFDEEDVKFRAGELADFVPAAARTHGFDERRVVAVGFSNGANIAGAVLLLRPRALTGAVLIRAMVPLEPERTPDLRGISVLLLQGRSDPIVPVAQADALAGLLRAGGADVSLVWQNAGHQLMTGDVETAAAWLGRFGKVGTA
jgi:phospholipase/carboxylesterase